MSNTTTTVPATTNTDTATFAVPTSASTATPSTARRQTRSMSQARNFSPTPNEPPIGESTPIGGNANEDDRFTDITNEPYEDEVLQSELLDEDELEAEIRKEELAAKRQYLDTLRRQRLAREKKGKGKPTQDKPQTTTQLFKQFQVHQGINIRPSGFRPPGEGPGPDPFGGDPDDPDDDGPGGNGGPGRRDDDDRSNHGMGHEPSFNNPFPLRTTPPDKYDPAGKTPVAEWLFKMNLWFDATRVHHQDKVTQAVLLLEGHALTWWMMLTRERRQPTYWFQFERQIGEQFTSFNDSLVARDKLYSTKQETSVSEYVGRFNKICLSIKDLAKSEAFYRFKKGLKQEIITKMDELDIQFREDVNSLKALQEAALRFDTVTFYHKSRGFKFDKSHKAGYTRRNLNEIDNKEKRKVTCFNCNKEGHIAKDCKKPKKANRKKEFIDTRKVNSITINYKAEPDTKVPEYKTPGSAGADLTPSESGTIPPFTTK